jgi:Na+/H+-dicarboxylate symporter
MGDIYMMQKGLIFLIIIFVAFIISLFFGNIRDIYLDALSIIWEKIQDFFTFQWVGDIFSNIWEVSTYGLVFGVLGVGIIFISRNQMLHPFLDSMPPSSKLIWGAGTYIGTFIAGYLVGKYFQNTA